MQGSPRRRAKRPHPGTAQGLAGAAKRRRVTPPRRRVQRPSVTSSRAHLDCVADGSASGERGHTQGRRNVPAVAGRRSASPAGGKYPPAYRLKIRRDSLSDLHPACPRQVITNSPGRPTITSTKQPLTTLVSGGVSGAFHRLRRGWPTRPVPPREAHWPAASRARRPGGRGRRPKGVGRAGPAARALFADTQGATPAGQDARRQGPS